MRIVRKLPTVAVVLLLFLLFVLWNNFDIQTETVAVVLENLPSAFDGLRIVELSDLHGRSFGEDNAVLLRKIAEAKPDLICICGDLVDEKSDLTVLPPLLRGLVAIAPTYYVTGNHEWQLENLSDVLAEMRSLGVTVLRNDYRILEKDGQRLVIAGVDDPCGPYDQKTPEELVSEIRASEGEDACIVMLAHRNDTIDLWSSLGVDLVLTGHCHGGVIRIPFVGGVFGSHRTLFPKYDAGLFGQNGTQLYVGRGLGYTNVHFRLFNRPHLPVLVLQS